jgi:hypothetical protein
MGVPDFLFLPALGWWLVARGWWLVAGGCGGDEIVDSGRIADRGAHLSS